MMKAGEAIVKPASRGWKGETRSSRNCQENQAVIKASKERGHSE